MSEDKETTAIKEPGVHPLQNGELFTFKYLDGYIAATAAVGAGKVDITGYVIPQIFYRSHEAKDNRDLQQYQCFAGDGPLWLAGYKPEMKAITVHDRSDPNATWTAVWDDVSQAYFVNYMGGNLRLDITGNRVTLTKEGLPWDILTFRECQYLSAIGQYADARVLSEGLTFAGDPRKSEVIAFQGLEDKPPLREVWHFERMLHSSDTKETPADQGNYTIQLVSDLQGPKYLAGDVESGKAFLVESMDDARAHWIVEESPGSPYYFAIRKSGAGKTWLRLAPDWKIYLTEDPNHAWIIKPLGKHYT